ncbi:hypothetical protein ACLGL1_00250 [Peptococcus simiae]|uniref:hypothetical protein n=1 Tax=Peptococcus simiae TaxID=1643805 RepID=UPI0039800264
MKKIIQVLCLMTTLAFLAGCSLVLAEPENLITAPVNDTAQLKERKIIMSLLADDEHLVVPAKMENPAPYINLDLTGDGKDEKVVFWAKNNGYQTGMNILQKQKDGQWIVWEQKRLSGRAVSYFKRLDFTGDGKDELFVGIDSGAYNTLYIFGADQKKGLVLVDQINYTHLAFASLQNNAHMTLITALTDTSSETPTTDLNMYGWAEGQLGRTFRRQYDGFCQGMRYGAISLEESGLYLALSTDFNSLNMVLLRYQDGTFREQLRREVLYVNALAEQPEGMIRDINDDGVLDVLSVRPPTDASKMEPREFLQIWSSWDGAAGLNPIQAYIDNKADGYRFMVPTSWLGSLQYQYVPQSGNNQLKLYDKDNNTGEPSVTIITREVDKDTDLKALKEAFTFLGASPSNQRIYLAKLGKDSFGSTKITTADIAEAFRIEGGR